MPREVFRVMLDLLKTAWDPLHWDVKGDGGELPFLEKWKDDSSSSGSGIDDDDSDTSGSNNSDGSGGSGGSNSDSN